MTTLRWLKFGRYQKVKETPPQPSFAYRLHYHFHLSSCFFGSRTRTRIQAAEKDKNTVSGRTRDSSGGPTRRNARGCWFGTSHRNASLRTVHILTSESAAIKSAKKYITCDYDSAKVTMPQARDSQREKKTRLFNHFNRAAFLAVVHEASQCCGKISQLNRQTLSWQS